MKVTYYKNNKLDIVRTAKSHAKYYISDIAPSIASKLFEN